MNVTEQLAKHFREFYFGGNWTAVNLKDTLADVDWQIATKQIAPFHSIATLVFHINYYITAVSKVLNGGPLDAKDKFSFDSPPIQSHDEWESIKEKTWRDAESFANQIEQIPDDLLWKNFTDEKYGNYCRNIQGIIEHCHYHLGQIVLLKKILMSANQT